MIERLKEKMRVSPELSVAEAAEKIKEEFLDDLAGAVMEFEAEMLWNSEYEKRSRAEASLFSEE